MCGTRGGAGLAGAGRVTRPVPVRSDDVAEVKRSPRGRRSPARRVGAGSGCASSFFRRGVAPASRTAKRYAGRGRSPHDRGAGPEADFRTGPSALLERATGIEPA
ncbi:hypothetical protein SSBG_00131 [Streptomyces sp. SPB074]|nr:hypothetical protein SSBG_00131 [Streptomyces sp. SPB074]